MTKIRLRESFTAEIYFTGENIPIYSIHMQAFEHDQYVEYPFPPSLHESDLYIMFIQDFRKFFYKSCEVVKNPQGDNDWLSDSTIIIVVVDDLQMSWKDGRSHQSMKSTESLRE